MAMELFKSMAGINVQHIPYRGVSQSVTDILGGRVSGMILNVLTSKPHIDQGTMRALGVTGLDAQRGDAERPDHRRERRANTRRCSGSAFWRRPARPSGPRTAADQDRRRVPRRRR